MEAPLEEKPNYKPVFIGLGYLLFFCLALVLCIGSYYLAFSSRRLSKNVFATDLPAITPSPHISFPLPSETSPIFADDFSDDHNIWEDNQLTPAHEIKDGKLVLESSTDGDYVIAHCSHCPYLSEPYYVQAEFGTDSLTDENFGMVFVMSYDTNLENFYLFQINQEEKSYSLYHHLIDNWSLRMWGESDQIRSYPATNTLGIYANKDSAEFYINGKIVDSFREAGTSFDTGYFGFYVDNSGFKLNVDNLVIVKANGQ